MPSKGIQAYSYLAVPGSKVTFYVPKGDRTHTQFRNFSNDHLEVDSSNIDGFFNYTGRFGFRVYKDNKELTHQWVEVNSMTGNLGDGTMNRIEQMRTVTTESVMISYGFYDAGSGKFGLPDRHQCYVTVSFDNSSWIEQVAPEGSAAAEKLVSHLALPCPHDCGMNDMQSTDVILSSPAVSLFTQLLAHIPGLGTALSMVIRTGYARKVIYALSITQKDSVRDMLRLGARYFEFRPAKLPSDLHRLSGLPEKYYFVHAVIPGLAFDAFLDTVIEFLDSNRNEIVVIHLRSDGVLDQCTKFNNAEADKVVSEALSRRDSSLQVASEEDLKSSTIAQLRIAHKRLVVVKDASQYSSYDDIANATLNGNTIIQRFEGLKREDQANYTFTILQCQATATNINELVAYSATASNAATSVLMATKAACDIKTLEWINRNAASRLESNKSLVIMNDWLDGATCDVAIELSKQRLQN